MSKKYPQRFRAQWLKDFRFQNWLQRHEDDDTLAYCLCCKCSIKAKICLIDRHKNTVKHRKAEENFMNYIGENDYENSKLTRKFDLSHQDPCETDDYITTCQVESLDHKFISRPKNIKSVVIRSETTAKNKAFDAIQSFCETINSPSMSVSSNFDNSDEAFAKYLGEELKNIKNTSVKKKLKQKMLNMLYNTEDIPDCQESSHPYPIFVSSQSIIPLFPLNCKNSTNAES